MSNRLLKTISNNSLVSRARDLYSYRRDQRRGTFAQHGEDVWLDDHFAGKREGTYVDIGASHPTRLSNTWKLYSDRKWSGVTVEPIPSLADAHRRWRKRDIQVQSCVATAPGKRTFYELNPSVLSTLDEATALAAVEAGTATVWRAYDIDVITLPQLFEHYIGGKTIDLLSIDMEGLDANVVEAYPFVEYRPRVIVAEWNDAGTKSRLLSHFTMCGYTPVAELGCNIIVDSG